MTTEERLKRLEKTNRILISVLVLAGLAATLVVTTGMGPTEPVPKEIKASKFTVIDGDGKECAGLGVGKDGPFLLLGNNGKLRIGLAATKDSTQFTMWADNNRPCAFLVADKEGTVFRLFDENGKERSMLVASNKGGPGLTLSDENGKRRAGLIVVKDGPILALMDENGQILGHLP